MSLVNDYVPTVRNNSSSSGRATTPQSASKISGARNITPKRTGSAPRSLSASKAANLSKAINAQYNKQISTNASHRKQRKWENDNMFGLQILFNKHADISSDDFYQDIATNMSMEVKWQNLFGELMLAENIDAMKAYLSCIEIPTHNRQNNQIRSVEDCRSEIERSHFSWNKMEKRLRVILMKCIYDNLTQQFIVCLEDILSQFRSLVSTSNQETQTTKHELHVFDSVKHLFLSDPFVMLDASSDSSTYGGSHLHVSLVDSSYHRLLLHAVCQYHCMNSKVIINNSTIASIYILL
jgi:hypothetical protein